MDTCRIILVTAFTKLLAICCFVQGVPQFSREPPSVLYASSGGTARLVWDYNVKNRSKVFDPTSPEWNFHNKSGSELRIGVDNGYDKGKFVINEECPTRLRGRVSREPTATLVISNVTTDDSGIYGCNLILLSGSPIRSRVHLIVTVPVQPANVSVSDIKMTSAEIKWLSPIDDTGSPVIEYKIQIEEIITLTKNILLTNTTIRHLYAVHDLTENTTYGVKVYARNAVGYGKAVSVEFTTKAAKASTFNKRLGSIDGAARRKVFAGVIGVVIWVGLMGTVVVLVGIKKRCSRRGKDQTNARRSNSNKTFTNNINNKTQPAPLCKQETSSQDVSEKKENSEPQTFPFYAKVDKKKKRRPGEIVYAELEQMQTKEDVPVAASNYFPQRYHETQYADIEH